MSTKNHGFVTKGFHWLTGGLLAYGYLKGLDSVDQLADPALLRFEILFASSLGLAFLARLGWTRFIGGTTRLPQDAPAWEKRASQIVHSCLYAGVFTIVLSGLAIAMAYSVPMLSGLFMATMIGLHEVAITGTAALIMAHIAGALWHKFVRRDGVMESMTGPLPSWRYRITALFERKTT